MGAADQTSSLDLLPLLEAVPGLVIRPDESLARHSSYRIGGPAEMLVGVETEAALSALLAVVAEVGCPFFLLGLGSNVLFPDGGLPGVVARLTGEFLAQQVDGTRVEAGGGVSLTRLARHTAGLGLAGLECLAGFPSTVGGAVCMNAGSYGAEIKDVLVSAAIVERDGRRLVVPVEELGAGYRTTRLQGTGAIVTRAVFRLVQGASETLLARIDELARKRRASLPSGNPHAGSVFRNPPDDYAGRLIEACGLKGARAGGAEISPRHANVIVNDLEAAAADVLELMMLARRAVEERFSVRLEPEVVLAGELAAHWRARVG